VAELAGSMQKFPQVLMNVPIEDGGRLARADPVWEAVRQAEEVLGEQGRVLVRASGTEPVIRVMVEAATEDEARKHAEALSGAIRTALA